MPDGSAFPITPPGLKFEPAAIRATVLDRRTGQRRELAGWWVNPSQGNRPIFAVLLIPIIATLDRLAPEDRFDG